MNKKQVLDLLKVSGKNRKAIRTGSMGKAKSYGIGLTELRKLARKMGRDHSLALEL